MPKEDTEVDSDDDVPELVDAIDHNRYIRVVDDRFPYERLILLNWRTDDELLILRRRDLEIQAIMKAREERLV
jgi:hypothetical protein